MTGYASPRLELQLLPTAHAPGIVRRRLVEEFASELDSGELQDAKLLASELVTNAVIHGSGRIELSALLAGNRLTVDVSDQGAGFEPAARGRDLEAVGGHGLYIVDVLASRWGIHEGASHVWFELERHSRLAAEDQRHGE